MKAARFDYVDALRGWAVLGVIAVHASQHVPGYETALYFGSRGVQLFFLLSAFTLALSRDRRPDGSAVHFYLRRLFRIAPMWWLAMIYYNAPFAAVGWKQVVATTFFVNALSPQTVWSIVPGGWSVGTEALFYVIFPLLAAYIATPAKAGILMLLTFAGGEMIHPLGLAILAPAATSTPEWREAASIWLNLPLFGSAFAAGLLCFQIVRKYYSETNVLRIRPVAEAALVAVLLDLAVTLIWNGHNIRVVVLSFAAVLLCVASGAGRYLTILPLRLLGKISFSAYLIHFALFQQVDAVVYRAGVHGPVAVAVYVAVLLVFTAAISTATYLLVERPFISLGEQVIGLKLRRSEPRH